MILQAVLLCFMLLPVAGRNTCNAQSMVAVRDSMARVASVNVLGYQFLILGELYKADKYKLPYRHQVNTDSMYQGCMVTYKNIFTAISPEQRAVYFPDKFYEQVIPVVQYFRNPDVASMLIQHRETLHPKAPVPDLKHHDAGSGHHHHHHNQN